MKVSSWLILNASQHTTGQFMTWIITLKYQNDTDMRVRATIEQRITDQIVENSYFDVLTWQFERMVEAMKKQMQEEKS
jgi:hypothetical protein